MSLRLSLKVKVIIKKGNNSSILIPFFFSFFLFVVLYSAWETLSHSLMQVCSRRSEAGLVLWML